MIPLRDNIPSRTTPWVNYLLIAVCTVVFLRQLGEASGDGPSLVERYGMIPARVVRPDEPVLVRDAVMTPWGPRVAIRPAAPPAVPPWLTLLTCIFLHGGWLHFLGNMWFLHIFGDNVEDRFGHAGFLVFYLVCGAAASAAHLAANPSSTVPTIGASGAIAGVMGAYMLLYPRALVLSVVPLFYFMEMVVLPAPVFLGVWFLLQFFQGALAVTSTQAGGVAWWAHIGGFAFGLAVAAGMEALGRVRPPVERRRPAAERIGAYRYRRRWH